MVDLDAKTQKVIVSMATKDKVQRQNIMTTLQQIQSGAMLRGTERLEAVTESKLTEYQKQLILTKLCLNQATAQNTVLNTQNTISLIEKILTQKGADKANKQELLGMLANIAATKQQTNANYELGTSMKALQASMGVWGWISIAASFLIPVIIELIGNIKSAKEQFQEISDSISQNKTEIESLNDELKTTQERITELESMGELSFTDASELKQLKAENAERERKIRLLEKENKEKSKEAVKTFKKSYNGFDMEWNWSRTTTDTDTNGNITAGRITEADYIRETIGLYHELIELEKDVDYDGYTSANGAANGIEEHITSEDLKKELDGYLDLATEYNNAIEALYESGYVYGSDAEVDKTIDSMYEIIDLYEASQGETTGLFDSIINRDKFSEARKSIEELADAGNLSAESLQNLYNQGGNVKEFIDYLLSLGTIDWKTVLGEDFDRVADDDGIVSTAEALDWMKESGENSAKVMGLVANELNKVEEAAKSATSAIKSFTDIADSFQDGYDAIIAAQKDVEEQNYLSADSVKALEKAGLTDYLKETEYGYLLVNDALNTYLEAQGKEYKDALDEAISQASSLATMQDAVAAGYKNDAAGLATYLRVLGAANNAMARNQFKDNLISKGFTVTEAHRMWMSSQQRVAADQAQSEYIAAANAIDAAIKNQKTYEMVRKTVQNDAKYSSGNKSSTDKNDEAEKYFEELKYQLETNKITQEQYLKELDSAYKRFYNTTADYLEDYAKYSQEVYEGFKDMYKDDLNAQKDAWEEKKKAVSEYYDNLRKQIEDAHDEEDYEKEQSEKRKEIFDLDMQIAELMRDGSEKAKARIAELEEERLKAQEDLLDFETDKAREDELKRLEQQQESEEAKIQKQIDAIDEELQNIDDDIVDGLYNVRKTIVDYAAKKGITLDFAYASGTQSSVGGFGRINEKGIEMISAPDGNGNYVNLMPGSYVFSAKATEFLWKLATEHSLPQAMYNSIAKSIQTQSNTPSVNIAQPITITMGDIIIKGNADKQTVTDIKKEQENTVRMVLQKIKELQK